MDEIVKVWHIILTTHKSYEGTQTDPTIGRNPSPYAYKRRPRPYKEGLLARRKFLATRALS
jgi:hypothetical protein